jgi:hypothetical protein
MSALPSNFPFTSALGAGGDRNEQTDDGNEAIAAWRLLSGSGKLFILWLTALGCLYNVTCFLRLLFPARPWLLRRSVLCFQAFSHDATGRLYAQIISRSFFLVYDGLLALEHHRSSYCRRASDTYAKANCIAEVAQQSLKYLEHTVWL